MMPNPRIKKCSRLQGKNLVFRDADLADASFILGLRTDARKSEHLSKVSADLNDQVAWLRKYQLRLDEAYFIITDMSGRNLGTVRIYDAQGESFCWGSWILSDDAPANAAIESALMVYAYAIDHLHFTRAHFQVNIGNERVWSFHERFGAIRVGSDDVQYHYEISGNSIAQSLQRYRRYLPAGVLITETIE